MPAPHIRFLGKSAKQASPGGLLGQADSRTDVGTEARREAAPVQATGLASFAVAPKPTETERFKDRWTPPLVGAAVASGVAVGAAMAGMSLSISLSAVMVGGGLSALALTRRLERELSRVREATREALNRTNEALRTSVGDQSSVLRDVQVVLSRVEDSVRSAASEGSEATRDMCAALAEIASGQEALRKRAERLAASSEPPPAAPTDRMGKLRGAHGASIVERAPELLDDSPG